MMEPAGGAEMRLALPTRLRKEPLLEAIWEMRFEPSQPSGGDLLAGVIFSALRAELELTKVQPLLASDMPAVMRDSVPNLRYQATTRLDGGRYVVLVGRRVLALCSIKPYVGWPAFRERIMGLLEIVEGADVVKNAERFSLKYVDVIPSDVAASTLSALRVSIQLGNDRLDRQPTVLRTEIRDLDTLHVITVASPVDYRANEQPASGGIAIDVDSIAELLPGDDLGKEVRQRIDKIHEANKRVFFDLLTPETLEKLEPEYQKEQDA